MASVASARPRTTGDDLPWDGSFAYGGWGGSTHFETTEDRTNTPVVFVHGNTRSADDWTEYAELFLSNGYRGDAVWAITFSRRTPSHSEMADELDEFVDAVRDWTGSETVQIVAHSLGVTGVRYWMERDDRYGWVDTVVCIAGANHGIPVCAITDVPGFRVGRNRPATLLNPAKFDDAEHPIGRLNAGDETPGNVSYYTIRGVFDKYFIFSPRSPTLTGAEENATVVTGHDGARSCRQSQQKVFSWLQ